jgi:hypothetical protein
LITFLTLKAAGVTPGAARRPLRLGGRGRIGSSFPGRPARGPAGRTTCRRRSAELTAGGRRAILPVETPCRIPGRSLGGRSAVVLFVRSACVCLCRVPQGHFTNSLLHESCSAHLERLHQLRRFRCRLSEFALLNVTAAGRFMQNRICLMSVISPAGQVTRLDHPYKANRPTVWRHRLAYLPPCVRTKLQRIRTPFICSLFSTTARVLLRGRAQFATAVR